MSISLHTLSGVTHSRHSIFWKILILTSLLSFLILTGTSWRHNKIEAKRALRGIENNVTRKHHCGVIVLSMHRSGSSLLTGLLTMMGLTAGPTKDLIEGNESNKFGFFERWDVISQNEAFLSMQGLRWDHEAGKYDSQSGWKAALNGVDFDNGRRALEYFNNPTNHPFVMKDPRLCITIRTWLPLFSSLPAVVFTYRHPLDVAMSFRAYYGFPIVRSLHMWYVYNRRAIQQSQDLCRVVTSDRRIIRSPKSEMNRIYTKLRDVCGVEVPRQLSDEDIQAFVDLDLQHGRASLAHDHCDPDVHNPPAEWEEARQSELEVLRKAMVAYCAMESGEAFDPFFRWEEEL